MKQDFTAPGQSVAVEAKQILSHIVFTGATGSAQLEVQTDGDWLPVGAAQTASATELTLSPNGGGPFNGRRRWRWDVTAATGGTISVYISNVDQDDLP